jgi:hypothetical protein
MASAWGSAFGVAWGDAWGATSPAPVVTTQYNPSGGGGGDGQPIEIYNWQSINDLFKVGRLTATTDPRIARDDETVIMTLIAATLENLL